MFDYHCSKWKKKRNRILRKDRYKCQIAKWVGKSEEANTVHHIYPAKDYLEYAKGNIKENCKQISKKECKRFLDDLKNENRILMLGM